MRMTRIMRIGYANQLMKCESTNMRIKIEISRDFLRNILFCRDALMCVFSKV